MSESAQARKKARNARNSGNIKIIESEVAIRNIPSGMTADNEYGEDAPQVLQLVFIKLVVWYFGRFLDNYQIQANRLIWYFLVLKRLLF